MRGVMYAFKVLCPEALMQSIMGPLGEKRDSLEERFHARIRRTEDCFPGTQLRGINLQVPAVDVIPTILSTFVDKLIECGDQERQQRSSGDRDEPNYLGQKLDEYLLRVVIAEKMAGALIGPRGQNIKRIREETAAKVFIEKNPIAGHHLLKVVGVPNNMKMALARINASVQEEGTRGEDWYRHYAERTSFGIPPGNLIGIDGEAGRRTDRSRSPHGQGAPVTWTLPKDQPNGDAKDLSMLNPVLDLLAIHAGAMPVEVFGQDHTLTCDLPREKVSALIGKHGVNVQQIRRETNTKIHFEEAPSGETQQTLVLQGPLLQVHRAHALMMKRYHEVLEPTKAPPPQDPPLNPDQEKVKAMQEELERLKEQLKTVQRSASAPEAKPQPEAMNFMPSFSFAGKGKGKSKDKSGKCKGGFKA
mmetsp:Transcript_52552/g.118297  ORF Transcript_52552/g.118297 Transcript_52552/m.118297 type:complete len:417 (-) Transcript_52552:51-1301(-)